MLRVWFIKEERLIIYVTSLHVVTVLSILVECCSGSARVRAQHQMRGSAHASRALPGTRVRVRVFEFDSYQLCIAFI